MDRVLAQRVAQAAFPERDLRYAQVLDEHRDDDLAADRELYDRRSDVRAGRSERRGLRGEEIEHRELVPGVEQTAGHALSHAAEANESDFHERP